jgi:Tfp pilus assembly protein FimT
MTIVIGLVAVLAVIVYPNINNITDRAKTTVSKLNEKTIQQANIMGDALDNQYLNSSSNIDISDIGNLQDITVNYTGSDNLYLFISSEGSRWYSYRDELNISKNKVLAAKNKIAVNSTNISDIKKKGLTPTLFNDLTPTDWSNNNLHFAYYAEDTNGNITTAKNASKINIQILGNNKTKNTTFTSDFEDDVYTVFNPISNPLSSHGISPDPWLIDKIKHGNKDGETITKAVYQSPDIPDNDSASLTMTREYKSKGTVSFDYILYCRNDMDRLEFYINGNLKLSERIGENNWFSAEFNVSSGKNTFEWRWQKDGSYQNKSDAVYVANIKTTTK